MLRLPSMYASNIAVGDLMFLGIQDFDFAQICPNFFHISPKFAKFCSYLPTFCLNCPSFAKKNFLEDAATSSASPAPTALVSNNGMNGIQTYNHCNARTNQWNRDRGKLSVGISTLHLETKQNLSPLPRLPSTKTAEVLSKKSVQKCKGTKTKHCMLLFL